jgi:hypothetical protein
MKGLDTYLYIWIGSNIAGILILLSAMKATKLARFIFTLLFGWACYINFITAHSTPEVYLEYASMSVSLYSNFIEGWFSENITIMVSVIAVCQGLIAVGMALKGLWVKLACAGAILFLTAIIPLGVGAGFPFSITVIFAVYFILKRDDYEYVWRFNNPFNKQIKMMEPVKNENIKNAG